MILHADGYVEIFGDRHVDVAVRSMPYMESQEGQILAEEYVALTLPEKFRRLYFPSCRRGVGFTETVRPENLLCQRTEISMTNDLTRIANQA